MKGAALVLPLALLRPAAAPTPNGFAEDALARQEVERLAMQAVMVAERALGREPRDVSAEKVGYDVESLDPKSGRLHFIEVKGRVEGADTIAVTTNEMLVALNAGERFVLAIVLVGPAGFVNDPMYVRRPFDGSPAPDSSATIFRIDAIARRATRPC